MRRLIFHHEVARDLNGLGRFEAPAVLKVIAERICHGSPDKAGKPLAGGLEGYRRLRVGDVRVVYRVAPEEVEVLTVAVGQRTFGEVR